MGTVLVIRYLVAGRLAAMCGGTDWRKNAFCVLFLCCASGCKHYAPLGNQLYNQSLPSSLNRVASTQSHTGERRS